MVTLIVIAAAAAGVKRSHGMVPLPHDESSDGLQQPLTAKEGSSISMQQQIDRANPPFAFIGWNVNSYAMTAGDTQNVTTPNFPKKYPNKAKYMWEFTTDPGTNLEATFIFFQMRSGPRCRGDWVKVIDGVSINDKICGLHVGLSYQTSAGCLRIFFKTNKRGRQRGFRLTVTAV